MYVRATIIALLAVSILMHLQTQVQLSFALHDRAHRPAAVERTAPARMPVTPAAQPTLDPLRPTQLVDVRGAQGPAHDLVASARFVPTFRDGTPYGVKVYAVRPNSSSAAWGLQNGDTLLSVNGTRPLSEEFVALLGDPPDFWDLEIERKGQRQRIVVLVHG